MPGSHLRVVWVSPTDKYHPLWDEGYLSVGDTHTTRKWEPGMAEEETRFFGLKRECGLHEG